MAAVRVETASSAATEQVRRALSGRRADVWGFLFQLLLLFTLVFALAVLVVLLLDVARTAIPYLRERGGEVFASGYSSLPANAGMKTGLIGSIYLGVFVLVLALPLGVCAAVYMEEYAKDTRLTRFINTNIRNLAGVPAIVYGILGLAIFVELLKPLTGPGGRGQEPARRRPDDRAHGPADRDHHHAGGPAGGPEEHPRGRVRRRGDPLGGDPQPRAPVRGARVS